MENYIVKGRIGEGAHGVVLKAVNKTTMELVAMKKITLKNVADGLPNSAVRELLALRLIQHDYVVRLIDYFPQGYSLVLVCEYLVTDLWETMRHSSDPLPANQIKSYLWMLIKGIEYIHSLGIMHRDLKPANLLISVKGVLKIADFGLCRIYTTQNPVDKKDAGSQREFTHQVASRWYRAPELLYGVRNYGPEIDLWAIGCIFGEMLRNKPLFPGENDIVQLCTVIQVLGTPNEDNWPGVSQSPDFHKISFTETKCLSFDEILPDVTVMTKNLMENFLVYHPKARIPADQALEHGYFREDPRMMPINELPQPLLRDMDGREFVDWNWTSQQFS